MPPAQSTIAILAGGLAQRLRPLTETLPKSLLPIAGEPFIAHQLRLMHKQGLRKVVICAGYLGAQIEAFVGDGHRYGLSVVYSFDGPVPLGTGGAIRQALADLGDEFFVIYGDSYLPTDFRLPQEHFRSSNQDALMTVYRNDGQWDRSNVDFENGAIRAYDKRNATPAMHHIDYGLGLFRRTAFETYPTGRAFDLADLYQNCLQRGQLAGFEVKERFYEIGSPQGLAETDAFLSRPDIRR